MIEVMSAGVYSSIQDQGRFGYRHIGVPVSGCMDLSSAHLANALLNNDASAAVMEMTLVGATLKFHNDTYIAVTGAQCAVKLNTVIKVNKGELIKFGKLTKGCRTYLAVKGGFLTKKAMGSRSYYANITEKAYLTKGDRLKTAAITSTIRNRASVKHTIDLSTKIKVEKGPEFDKLSDEIKQQLLKQKFSISPMSNRMATMLTHNNAQLKCKEIMTSSTQVGTVQLTPSGQLIILMRDCQTTGGYSRILQLPEKSICQLAQFSALRTISFKLINK